MRKTFILSLFILIFSGLYSQDLKVLNTNGQVINDTVIYTGNANNSFSEHLWVYNSSSTDINVKVKFEIIELAKGCGYAFCWDQCLGTPRSGTITGSINIPAGDTSKVFVVDYDPQGYPGYSLFRFGFFAEGSSDTTVIYVGFDITNTSPVEAIDGYFKIYPNPATDYLIITNDKNTGLWKVELIDLLGKKVLSQSSISPNLVLDVRNLKNGIYFLTIKEKDKKQNSYKVIINH